MLTASEGGEVAMAGDDSVHTDLGKPAQMAGWSQSQECKQGQSRGFLEPEQRAGGVGAGGVGAGGVGAGGVGAGGVGAGGVGAGGGGGCPVMRVV